MTSTARRRNLILALGTLGAGGGWVFASPTAALNALSSIGSRRAAAGLPYGRHVRQRFDLYLPEAGEPPPSGFGWPMAVFFYGGAWRRGERGDYRFVGEALAQRGIAAMVADYRLHPEVRYPDFLKDCAAAVSCAVASAAGWGVDPRRLFVMGHSAGAYNAAMLALDQRWLAGAGLTKEALAGWIGLAGPYDFLPIRTLEVQPVFGHPEVPADSQPLHHAAQASRPALLLAAAKDTQVDPQRSTVRLAARMAQAGAPVQHRLYDRVDHASLLGALAVPLRGWAPVLAEIEAFIGAVQPR